MNADEMAEADARWNALPGTRPNAYGFRSNEELEGRNIPQEIAAMKATLGGTFCRVTKTDDGLWVETWDQRPHKQAEFDPPYTLTPPTQQ